DRVRIRYPEGMSWLAGGTLRLSGTPSSATLSGRVLMERVTLAEGLQVAGMLVSAREGIAGPVTASSYLRNLQFDVEALSAPDDIITLLALGQTTAESAANRGGGTSPSGTASASAILSEAVSSQLGGRLERLFGITRFRVDPGLAEVGSTGSEQNAAARVTVE